MSELKVSRLLDKLRHADEAYAIDHPEDGPLFRLDLIRTEMAPVKAGREAAPAAQVLEPK